MIGQDLTRPQLVLLGHSAARGGELDWDQGVEEFAAGVELQHLFMLVHDDLMDHGTIRRGRETVPVVLASGNAGRQPVHKTSYYPNQGGT